MSSVSPSTKIKDKPAPAAKPEGKVGQQSKNSGNGNFYKVLFDFIRSWSFSIIVFFEIDNEKFHFYK